MPLLPQTLDAILRAGGSLTIYSGTRLPNTLMNLASVAHASGAHLTIKVNSNLLPATLVNIARAGQGAVTLDLT